jgi:hypothetical protein
VWTTDDRAMAAGLSGDLDRWRRESDELMLRIGGRFARVEPRRRMAAFVRGLLAGLPRVNCWSIAEHTGEGPVAPHFTLLITDTLTALAPTDAS